MTSIVAGWIKATALCSVHENTGLVYYGLELMDKGRTAKAIMESVALQFNRIVICNYDDKN